MFFENNLKRMPKKVEKTLFFVQINLKEKAVEKNKDL